MDGAAMFRQTDNHVKLGRAIRRLVSLADRVEDMVAEADRRACEDDGQRRQYTDA